MIEKFIANWLKAFRQSNPKIWGIVAVVLTVAKIAIEYLVGEEIILLDAPWVEWAMWAIALLLGSGGVAKYKYAAELKATEANPQKMIHLPNEDKIAALEQRNKVLEEIVQRA